MSNISRFRKIVFDVLKENNIDPEELFFEHAKHLDYAEDKITDLGENICDHLLECLMFGPNDIDYDHWLKEISGWLISVSRIKLKMNNKSPNVNKIKKWLTDGITDFDDKINIALYNNILDNIIDKYSKTKNPINKNVLYQHPNEFLIWYLNLIEKCYLKSNIKENLQECCLKWFSKFKE